LRQFTDETPPTGAPLCIKVRACAHEPLAIATATAYSGIIGHLSRRLGHCREVAQLGAAQAERLGIETREQCGYHRDEAGIVAWHAWLQIGDYVLHSPRIGEVAIVPDDPARFEVNGHMPAPGRVTAA
jgi:hypothetical protein